MYQKIHNRKEYLEARRTLRNNPTPEEVLVWQSLRNRLLGYKFRRQHSFGPYIVDFYCSEKRLIIEIDGDPHFKKNQPLYDERGSEYFRGFGYTVMRFTNHEVNVNLAGVLQTITTFLEGGTLPSPDQGEGRSRAAG